MYSVTDICRRLQGENISISCQALTYARGGVVVVSLYISFQNHNNLAADTNTYVNLPANLRYYVHR